jgi:hypothetical protein
MNNKIIWLGIIGFFLYGCGGETRSIPTPTLEIAIEENLPPPTPPSTVPELIDILMGDYGDEARIGAAHALGEMGARATPAIPALTINLKFGNELHGHLEKLVPMLNHLFPC